MTEQQLTVTVRKPHDQVAVIDIAGDLNADGDAVLFEAYEDAGDDGVSAVILNFAGLEYMNSSGIGLLVTLLIRANRKNQRLYATGMTDHYREIFELTRIDEAIPVFDTEAEALAAAAA